MMSPGGRWPRPLTLYVGAVQFGLEQHPETRNLLTLQLIQPCPHVVAHQVQFFSQVSVLKQEVSRSCNLNSSSVNLK